MKKKTYIFENILNLFWKGGFKNLDTNVHID